MAVFEKDRLIEVLSGLKDESSIVKETLEQHDQFEYISGGAFDAWRNKVLAFLDQFSFIPSRFSDAISDLKNEYPSSIDALEGQVAALIDLIQNDYISCEQKNDFDTTTELENIFNRFHKVARQLRTRHSDRETLKIGDEYDVQDLLHALLLLFFDDVRAEEWTPSYAGGCVRMDFLLKEFQTVIEVKKTRDSMSAKDLGEQLIIDIEKYEMHPDCKQLYCFVYDPEGLLGNPVGIKKDLESAHEGFLKVFIKPE